MAALEGVAEEAEAAEMLEGVLGEGGGVDGGEGSGEGGAEESGVKAESNEVASLKKNKEQKQFQKKPKSSLQRNNFKRIYCK